MRHRWAPTQRRAFEATTSSRMRRDGGRRCAPAYMRGCKRGFCGHVAERVTPFARGSRGQVQGPGQGPGQGRGPACTAGPVLLRRYLVHRGVTDGNMQRLTIALLCAPLRHRVHAAQKSCEGEPSLAHVPASVEASRRVVAQTSIRVHSSVQDGVEGHSNCPRGFFLLSFVFAGVHQIIPVQSIDFPRYGLECRPVIFQRRTRAESLAAAIHLRYNNAGAQASLPAGPLLSTRGPRMRPLGSVRCLQGAQRSGAVLCGAERCNKGPRSMRRRAVDISERRASAGLSAHSSHPTGRRG